MKYVKVVLIFLLLFSSYAWGEKEKRGIDLNIRDMGIRQFVEMVGKITEKNILINGELKGKINFIANKPIKKEALFSLANSILASKGYAIIDHGDFMEVVRASEAAGMGLKVDQNVQGKTMKTVLFPLKNTNASVIRAKIRPLLTRNAKVISFKENNVLSVTAYPKTLKSIKALIDAIENAGHKGSIVVKLKYASVKDVYPNAVNIAKQLFPQTIPSEKVGVFKDEASNSILIVGKKKNVEKMLKYVKQLDRRGQSVEQRLYVIPLKNSNVEEMEKILGKLVSQMNDMSSMHPKKGGKASKKAMVVGDSERNALIVLATGEQYKNIDDVVRRIDVEKPQVYIKARVVEINSRRAQQIGAKYGFEGGAMFSNALLSIHGNFGGGSALKISPQLLGFVNNSQSTSDQNGSSPFSFKNVSALFALGVQLDLYQEDGAAHVLSEPSVLCTNNKESELFVGETRSILTSSTAGDNKNDLSRNNYSRQDIGLTLKVKPRLSSNNKVTLTVDAIIEDVDDSSGYNNPLPTVYKRKVTSNAIVRNGQTVIIGGLMKNIAGKAKSKVPFFGDIPLIGRLFRDEGNAHRKVDLVIYLTPYIVRKSSDLARLRTFLAKLEQVQKRYTKFIQKNGGKRNDEHTQERGGQRDLTKGRTHHGRSSHGNKALDLLRSHP